MSHRQMTSQQRRAGRPLFNALSSHHHDHTLVCTTFYVAAEWESEGRRMLYSGVATPMSGRGCRFDGLAAAFNANSEGSRHRTTTRICDGCKRTAFGARAADHRNRTTAYSSVHWLTRKHAHNIHVFIFSFGNSVASAGSGATHIVEYDFV